ncbi:hypothetical protein ECIV_ORF2 [European chub iridovirus]|nr:hypothetical protein ECIV_ORF2 [European chub iridovirus]
MGHIDNSYWRQFHHDDDEISPVVINNIPIDVMTGLQMERCCFCHDYICDRTDIFWFDVIHSASIWVDTCLCDSPQCMCKGLSLNILLDIENEIIDLHHIVSGS